MEQRVAEMLLVKLLRLNISQGKSPVVDEKLSPRKEYVCLLVEVPFPFLKNLKPVEVFFGFQCWNWGIGNKYFTDVGNCSSSYERFVVVLVTACMLF